MMAIDAGQNARDRGLVRAVGVWAFAASIINGVVGAGIFSLPSAMASLTGDWAPAAFLLCAVAIGAVVLCAAEASGRVATSGGGYGYVDAAFGPVAAFVTGTFIWIAAVLACGGIAAALADGLAASIPVLGDPMLRAGIIVLVIGGLCLLNIAGVSPAARVVTVLTVIKLLPLLILVVVGGFVLLSEGRAPATPQPAAAFGQGVILALFAFSGMETPLSASGEVTNPARNIPRALFLAMGLVTALYIAVQLVTEGLLGDALAGSVTPLADAMSRVSPALGMLLLLGASLSRFAWIGSDILGAPRVLFAFARDGMLPGWLAAVYPRTHAPHVAIIFHGVLAILLAITGMFEVLAILSGLSTAIIYIMICTAAWRLHKLGATAAAEAPHYAILPIVALVGILSMIAIIAFGAWRDIVGLCLVAVASVAWALFRRPAKAA